MITIKKSGIRALIITLFTMLIISSMVVIVKAMNSSSEEKVVEKKELVTYYFKFNGSPGQEANEALWEHTDTPGIEACSGDNDGCLIEVEESFTTIDSNNKRVLTQAVPVIQVGAHRNPDESSTMILSASNKNP